MRSAGLTILCTIVLALLPASYLLAEAPPGIRHDPFSRPPLRSARDGVDTEPDADASPLGLDLRITLVSNGRRLANIGGRVMRVGEEIDGYTLVRVHEDRAEFLRQNRRFTVYVKPIPVENDERLDD